MPWYVASMLMAAAPEAAPAAENAATPWPIFVAVLLAVLVLPFVLGGYLAKRLRMPDHGWKIGLVLFSLSAAGTIVYYGWPPKLGIDLSGGVILVYEVDEEVQQSDQQVDMDKLINAISRRINPGGVREITVRQYGPGQVEIIIPEADENELERTKERIVSAGTLEFRILANSRDHGELIERARGEDSRVVKDSDGNMLAWWVPVEKGQEGSFQGYQEIATRKRPRPRGEGEMLEILVVNDTFDVNGGFLARAAPSVDQQGRPCVNFVFNSRGGRLFGGLTGNNLPDEVQNFTRKLGIILDGYLYSAPAIQSRISQRGEITGDFTNEEVEDLVAVLNAGSLPTALAERPISELLTGPTLGQDTIERGAYSISLSMVIVLIFMLVYYRFAGIVACMALLGNLLLILAIMISVNAAFTLPGLAGLVLTIGMAVDANVLIFERIREELGRNAALRMAIRNGFGRALSAIVDASLTTLLTATVLYAVGTDQIRGFAVTLWLGVVMSMYTGIFCSRVVFDIAERRKWITELHMMRLLDKPSINFLGMRRTGFAVSSVVILVGLVGVTLRGSGLLDIDFTGGVSVEIVFDEQQEIEEIRKQLDELDDLVVSDVQIEGEEPGHRFRINTSEKFESEEGQQEQVSAIDAVEAHLKEVFGDELASNSLAVERLSTAGEETPEPAAETVPEADAPGQDDVGRRDLPGDSLLASADPGAVLLAQADDAEPEEPSGEPGDAEQTPAAEEKPADAEPAEKEPNAEDKPEPKPAPEGAPTDEQAETKSESEEEPAASEEPAEAEAAAQEPAASEPMEEAPAEQPAEDEPSPAAGLDEGTTATVTFESAIDYETVNALIGEVLDSTPRLQGTSYSITNPQYVEGSSLPYETWQITLDLPEGEAEKVLAQVDQTLQDRPYFPSSSTIGGKVAANTQTQAIYALGVSLLGIIGYIWLRFQRVVYGVAAVVALVHDVLVTLGMLAISAWLAPVLPFLMIDPFKISLSVLAAFLTIIGYSLNDTIVVFDRIREVRGKAPVLTGAMINESINQTLSRTLLTSLTTLIVVLILYVGGGEGIHAFAFSLVVGVIVGTYSSIFVASPVLHWLTRPADDKVGG